MKKTGQRLQISLILSHSASILTKSDLVLRDMELLQNMARASIRFSMAFNDDRTRRLFEANTIDNEKRIDALRLLKDAGIRTGALLCPVIPYITDAVKLIDKLAPCTDAIWIYGLGVNDRSGRNWLNPRYCLPGKGK